MENVAKIVTAKDLQDIYTGLSRDEIYALLNIKGCPVLPRKRNAPYKVLLAEFDSWLRSIRK